MTSIQIVSKKKIQDFDKYLIADQLPLRFIFETISTDYEEQVGISIMQIFWNAEKDVQLLCNVCIPKEVERTDDEGLLFRGNSVFIYMMTEYVRLNGLPFLRKVLTPAIKFYLTKENLCYEVDPTRCGPSDDLQRNARNLVGASQYILDQILQSVDEVPAPIKECLQKLYQAVEKKFPGAGKRIISALFFLRFVCPSVVSPKLHGLISTEKGQTKENMRGLILVAKLFQNIANELPPLDRDPHTTVLNEFVARNIPKVQQFCDTILKADSNKKFKAKRKSTAPEASVTLARWLRQHLPAMRERCSAAPADFPPSSLARLEQLLDQLIPRPPPAAGAVPPASPANSTKPPLAGSSSGTATPSSSPAPASGSLTREGTDQDSSSRNAKKDKKDKKDKLGGSSKSRSPSRDAVRGLGNSSPAVTSGGESKLRSAHSSPSVILDADTPDGSVSVPHEPTVRLDEEDSSSEQSSD